MINQLNKVIYVHPPKTGGWSIINIYGAKSPLSDHDGDTRFECFPNHHTMQFYSNRGFDLGNYFRFATTRNPWERVVSAYSWLSSNAMNRLGKQRDGSEYTFEKYVSHLASDRIELTHDKNNSQWTHPNCVVDYISVDGSVSVDYICSMDTMQRDFEFVRGILECRHPLPHANKSSHGDYRTYYTDATAETVGRVFKKDVDYFGYRFDDPAPKDFDRVVDRGRVERYRRNRKLLVNGCTRI